MFPWPHQGRGRRFNNGNGTWKSRLALSLIPTTGAAAPLATDSQQSKLRWHCAAAAGIDGVLYLTTIYPGKKNGETDKVRPQPLKIGNVEGMVTEALGRAPVGNVYLGLHVVRRGLPFGERGGEGDIVAVIGAALDDDHDTSASKRALRPPGIEASIELTTSTQPTINRQPIYLFDRALSPKEGK